MVSKILKYVRYCLEAFLLSLLLLIFRLMPAHSASDVGGWLGRTIGPKLAASRKARRNIERALPKLDETRQKEIVTGMWDHLGRVIAEYPHLKTLAAQTDIIGEEHLEAALQNPNGAIFFGAHLGNWEINAPAILLQYNKAIDISYRAPNNPWSDAVLSYIRSMNGRISAHAKSAQGGKGMMGAIKSGGGLGILIDQKYNEGLSVPFFGMEAMTNPFFVQLAQKYGCALVPIRNIRNPEGLDPASFSLTIYEPIAALNADGSKRAIEDVIKDAHALLEGFIKDTPEQWLWLHRRWKD